MPRKEFVRLIEENIMIFHKLGDRLKAEPVNISGYSRQQLAMLIGLQIGGRARLKDIARREFVTAPNLCGIFRKLEQDGVVERMTDEDDRRNTWYSVTPRGAEIAKQALEIFREAIEKLFVGMSKEDEAKFIETLKTMNNLLNKVEINNV